MALAVGYFTAGMIGEHFGALTLLTCGGLLLLVATPLLTLTQQGISALNKNQPARPQQQSASAK